ncbi:glycosyltransferase [Oceanobacillus piezotolerans]|uniref:Glycosyltransferase n=1 Tax=Oceanobacillus piezotolerans TaxID=2448030 RepID=A0A498DBH5_9BACI|nr:glycosyltransferase [Oceanobacillus piezotolerans]RLL46918.1 glycosyltransferase [Oceanobacillus piezotolerans]
MPKKVKKKKNNQIKVSLIMPSYNKFPLNLMSLYSLENQTFNLDEMEVIFIDDASTDDTSTIPENNNFSFHFKYIRKEENQGRAKVRNAGILAAQGELIIFLDAEMLADPRLVENHWLHHQQKDNLIITGAMHYKAVYSFIFPEFNRKQIRDIQTLTTRMKRFSRRLNIYESRRKNDAPFELITKEDIQQQSYNNLVIEKRFFAVEVVENFGNDLEGFQFPWMAFLTGNVSLRKDLLDKAGLFNEKFVGYGYEDWELGYRLYKAGGIYCASDKVTSYHQEHPISYNKWHEATKNFYLFTQLHPEIEVLIMGLEIARITDLLTMNAILKEYKSLEQVYPNQFSTFKADFYSLLQTVALFLKIDLKHKGILNATGIEISEKTHKEISEIKQLGDYNHLVTIFEKLISS